MQVLTKRLKFPTTYPLFYLTNVSELKYLSPQNCGLIPYFLKNTLVHGTVDLSLSVPRGTLLRYKLLAVCFVLSRTQFGIQKPFVI